MSILIAATILSCSTGLLTVKSSAQCRTCTCSIKIFTSASAKKVLRAKWWFSTKLQAWNITKNKLSKILNSVTADFPFGGIKVNIIILKKKTENSTFHGWSFKNWGIKYAETWDPVVVCPPHQNSWLRACWQVIHLCLNKINSTTLLKWLKGLGLAWVWNSWILLSIEWHFVEMRVNYLQQSKKQITYNQAESNIQGSGYRW